MSGNIPRVKILILGEGGVGKTSLLSQFIDQEFKYTHMPTIGVEYKQKMVDYLCDKPIRVQSTHQTK
jgi:GTPase SAR1 family protein